MAEHQYLRLLSEFFSVAASSRSQSPNGDALDLSMRIDGVYHRIKTKTLAASAYIELPADIDATQITELLLYAPASENTIVVNIKLSSGTHDTFTLNKDNGRPSIVLISNLKTASDGSTDRNVESVQIQNTGAGSTEIYMMVGEDA